MDAVGLCCAIFCSSLDRTKGMNCYFSCRHGAEVVADEDVVGRQGARHQPAFKGAGKI